MKQLTQPHVYSPNPIEYSDDFLLPKLNLAFWSTKKILDGRYEFVSTMQVPRGRAVQVSVRPGDLAETAPSGTSTERSELMEKKPDMIVPVGVKVWYAFSLFIPLDFKISSNRLVFAQWKQEHSTRSPSMALRYKNGVIIFTVESDAGRTVFNAPPVSLGTWHRIVVSRYVAPDHRGYCEAILNGETFATYEGEIGNTADPVSAYFKMGVYRDRVEYVDTLYFASFRRGGSKEFCNL